MFANPTQPGSHPPGFIHHRLNVDANFPLSAWPLFFSPGKQRAKFSGHDIVVVVTPRVTRDFTGFAAVLVFVWSEVVESHDHHGLGWRKQFARVGALVRVAG